MHFKRLDLNLLVALDALLTEKNTTRAAERVHVAQPSMSGSLARLREYFGDDLLVQVGRRMVLTPRGESLAGPVRDILLHVEAAIETRPGFDPATAKRNFTLMLSDYTTTVLMPELLRRTQPVAPNVTFEVWPPVENPAETIERGEIDVLIIPEPYLSKVHPYEALFEETYVVLVWAENPLVGESISLDEYLNLGHIIVKFGSLRAPAFDEWFMTNFGHVRRVEVSVPNFSAVPPLLVGTTRIATVHKRIADLFTGYMPLRKVPLPIEIPVLIENVQWNKYRDLDPGNEWLRGILKAIANEVQ